MLEAVHLVKRFAGITAVNDVSFVIRPGEIVGYLGPNGSGKTTTTRMLTGLLDPSSGHVHFEGRLVDADPIAFRRRLGYVPEEPVLDLGGDLLGPARHVGRQVLCLLGLHLGDDVDAGVLRTRRGRDRGHESHGHGEPQGCGHGFVLARVTTGNRIGSSA